MPWPVDESFEVPALLGYLGVAGAAKDGLVGGRLDLWPAGASHATGFDVMNLQVTGGATDLALGIGGDAHLIHPSPKCCFRLAMS